MNKSHVNIHHTCGHWAWKSFPLALGLAQETAKIAKLESKPCPDCR